MSHPSQSTLPTLTTQATLRLCTPHLYVGCTLFLCLQAGIRGNGFAVETLGGDSLPWCFLAMVGRILSSVIASRWSATHHHRSTKYSAMTCAGCSSPTATSLLSCSILKRCAPLSFFLLLACSHLKPLVHTSKPLVHTSKPLEQTEFPNGVTQLTYQLTPGIAASGSTYEVGVSAAYVVVQHHLTANPPPPLNTALSSAPVAPSGRPTTTGL